MNRSTSSHKFLQKSKSKSRRLSKRFSRPNVIFKQEADYTIRKSLAELVRDELRELKQELFFQRVYMFGKNVEEVPELKNIPSNLQQEKESFYDSFSSELEDIIIDVEDHTFTEDKLNGMFLCMGDITLLVVEGSEDMVGEFFSELWINLKNWWTETRIFLVEDKIKSVYFDVFICRQSAAVNVNEKFPTSTPNDETEMFLQHWKIKEKLLGLCETLSKQIREEEDTVDELNEHLAPETYNKFLPEVQRLELVFLSKRFYRNLLEFAKTYEHITIQESELDTMIWPLMYNYTPAGIFKSSEFEVNLTFGDYGKEEAKAAEPKEATSENEEHPSNT